MSIRMDRILKFVARSAIRWHSTACCRHSTGVIIVALMTPLKTLSEFTPYNEPRVNVGMAIQNHCGAQTTQELMETQRD
jgi:hypothetical protein